MKSTTLFGLVLVTLNLSAATLYVSLESTNPIPPYASWETAATVIQHAVDAAKAGDTVLVTNGVYAVGLRAVDTWSDRLQRLIPQPSRVVVTNPIRLESVNGPDVTLVFGEDYTTTNISTEGFVLSGVRCAYLATNAILSGFTLTNGHALAEHHDADGSHGSVESGMSCGGGVLATAPDALITNCIITHNSAGFYGGGVYGGTVYDSSLTGNSAGRGSGGGAYGSTLYRCTLTGNSASYGGGASYCTLHACMVSENWAGRSPDPFGAGASFSTLYSSSLIGNWGGHGVGVALSTLYNCTLIGNSGDLAIRPFFSTFYNCILTGNSSWGFVNGIFYNCTIVRNQWGIAGVAFNSIVYGNYGHNYDEGGEQAGPPKLHYCCTTPLPTHGIGNTAGPPLFMDMEAGDLRLREDSPCIDTGTNLVGLTFTDPDTSEIAIYAHDATDVLGNTRLIDGNFDGKVAWDIGAYEFISFKPPRFAPQLRPSPDGLEFTVTGEPGKIARIERSRNLVDWEHVATVPIPAGGLTLIDPAAPPERFLFYRAAAVP